MKAESIHLQDVRAFKQDALAGFERFLQGDGLPPWPLEIFVEVSNACNLRCAMCGTFSAVNPRKYMLMSEVERDFFRKEEFPEALNSVLQHALAIHAFGYGEPTIHPQFTELIRYLGSFGAFVDFFTNGMKLDAKLCDFLVQEKIGGVCISFSGATAEAYENLYIGGEFQTVLDGVRRLHESKVRHGSTYPKIQVNSIGYDHHISHLVEFVELMAGVGANTIFVKRASPDIPLLNDRISIYRPWIEGEIIARAKARAAELGVMLDTQVYESAAVASDEEWMRAKEQLLVAQIRSHHSEWRTHVDLSELKSFSKHIEPWPNRERMPTAASAMDVPENELADCLQVRAPSGPVTPCMEPFKTMYIQQEGTVKPCCFAPRGVPTLGSIVKNSGEEIWRGQGFDLMQRAILNGEYPWSICGNCIEHNQAPQSHHLAVLVDTYRDWFRAVSGEEFITPIVMNRILHAPDNHRVVRLHNVAAGAEGAATQLASYSLRQLEGQTGYNIDEIAGVSFGPELTIALDPTRSIRIDGWAVDSQAKTSAAAVEIAIDGKRFAAQYGTPREDVAKAFQEDAYAQSGFSCVVPAQALTPGHHILSVCVIANGAQGVYIGPGIRIAVTGAVSHGK